MKKLIIIGTGNFSKVVEEHARKSMAYNKEWVIKGYLKSEFDTGRRFYLFVRERTGTGDCNTVHRS